MFPDVERMFGSNNFRVNKVTTNSQEGVLDIEQLYPVFAAMEKFDLVLNLHGEMISTPSRAVGKQTEPVVTVLNAEPLFVPQLAKLHKAFPKLRIILEHVSTRQGLDAVRACGPNVCTIDYPLQNVTDDL